LLPFIYPYQANSLRYELTKLLNVVYFAGDYRVYQATKDLLEVAIKELFGPMTPKQAALFAGITEIKGKRAANDFISSLRPYLIPFHYDADKVLRLFKKEKKLTIPDSADMDLHALSYVGWRDLSKKKIYIVYPYRGELAGIRARYTIGNHSQSGVCCLCLATRKGSEIGLVVADSQSASLYRAVGNYMCLDSEACNEQIRNVQGIEFFFAQVFSR